MTASCFVTTAVLVLAVVAVVANLVCHESNCGWRAFVAVAVVAVALVLL